MLPACSSLPFVCPLCADRMRSQCDPPADSSICGDPWQNIRRMLLAAFAHFRRPDPIASAVQLGPQRHLDALCVIRARTPLLRNRLGLPLVAFSSSFVLRPLSRCTKSLSRTRTRQRPRPAPRAPAMASRSPTRSLTTRARQLLPPGVRSALMSFQPRLYSLKQRRIITRPSTPRGTRATHVSLKRFAAALHLKDPS